MKRYLHLKLNRIRAAFMVITSRRFVVIVYNKPGKIDARYNVALESYRALTQVVEEAYEQIDGEDSVLEQAKEVLNKSYED